MSELMITTGMVCVQILDQLTIEQETKRYLAVWSQRFTSCLGTASVSMTPTTIAAASRYTPAFVEPVASFSHPTA